MNKVAKHVPHTWMKWMRPVLKPNHLPFCIRSLSTYFHKCCFCLVIYKFLLVNVNTILLPSCTSSKLPFHWHCWTRNLDVYPCVTSREFSGELKPFSLFPCNHTLESSGLNPNVWWEFCWQKLWAERLVWHGSLVVRFLAIKKRNRCAELEGQSGSFQGAQVLTLWCTVKQTPRTRGPWNYWLGHC